ncbi:MAG: CPBP family intramembrane glutamic endopeptidase, partial [Verrucomicrobiota bacterium]
VFGRNPNTVFGFKRGKYYLVLITVFGGTIVAFLLCNWAVGTVSQNLIKHLLGELDLQEPVQAIKESKSLIFTAVSCILAVIVAPVVEELLFRGYLYPALKKQTSALFAALVSGAIFAVVHANLPAFLPLWSLAILLCLSYELTRTIWAPIGIHALFNLMNVIMLFQTNEGGS